MGQSILLEITLASPLKLTHDVLQEIKRLAGLTTALTILVHTLSPIPKPSNAEASAGLSKEGMEWDQFQAIVVGIYTAATKVFLEENRPLSTVDALFDSIRQGKKLAGEWDQVVSYTQQDVEGRTMQENQIPEAWSDGTGGRGQKLFEVTALGGTFDHLHAGHKILLTMSAWITTKRLIVGITGQSSVPFVLRKSFSRRVVSMRRALYWL